MLQSPMHAPKGAYQCLTSEFAKRRRNQRDIEHAMMEKKRNYIEDTIKQGPKESNTFSSLISGGKFCRTCGQSISFFISSKSCLRCELSLCEHCTFSFDRQDELELVSEFLGMALADVAPEKRTVCELCWIEYGQFFRSTYRMYLAGTKEHNELHAIYGELSAVKSEIERIYPHFEYLANSIFESSPPCVGEHFASTFYDVKEKQTKLWDLIKSFQFGVKKVMDATLSCHSERKVLGNIKSDLRAYSERKLPQLKNYQQMIAAWEVEALGDAYVEVGKLADQLRHLPESRETFGKLFDRAIQIIRNDILPLSMKAGFNWNTLGTQLEDRIKSSASSTGTSGVESIAMRKMSSRLKEARRQLERKGIRSPNVLSVISTVIKAIDDEYNKDHALFVEKPNLDKSYNTKSTPPQKGNYHKCRLLAKSNNLSAVPPTETGQIDLPLVQIVNKVALEGKA